ncbi:DUF4955 domain-containing protein [Pedobacter sp. BS3]|uniref:DUF4955 domain-containing protein n=1 Tax=Pedobacter sp. BS3 TaxID=2567937 RepID=UPI0011F05D23|nr:DUF4955 domain-containing protein [Pedobacter sp. BS3]TZF82593.1 DUF4955 domain-containing protein [Pedobacter sp. BS3]
MSRFCIYSVVLCLFTLSGYGQKESTLFESFKKKPAGAILPDFSYAGYHHGEQAIPTVNYRVFDVTKFGAVPNDTISDKAAIEAAVQAARINGSGIIFFPKGRFRVNEDTDKPESILITSGNIVFRGSGSGPGGTELYMKNSLQPANPEQMWTTPPMFVFTTAKKDERIGEIANKAAVGTFDIKLTSTGSLEPGDWVMLRMQNNSPALIQAELGNYKPDSAWTSLVKNGVFIKVYHQVKEVSNNYVTLVEPLTYPVDPKYKWEVYKAAGSSEVGVEDIAFVGNWKEKFVHHKSWVHDSGWTMLRFARLTNSWVRNCRFTDVNVGFTTTQGANISVINCIITGNEGHEAITNTGSTNVFFGKITDEAGMWHSVGTNALSMNTVVWRVTYPPTTCFESHSSQPRNTLLDCVQGGLLDNRGGGAIQNMPNHMQNLILWNYKQTNEAVAGFDFWPANRRYWKIPNPVIVGFHGAATTFKPEQLKYSESIGQPVEPESLYEAQLKLRLKKIPDWVLKLKSGDDN